MSRHDALRATWSPGQIWETRIEECAADPNAWVPVAGGGRMEPLWEERQEYRQKPEADARTCTCHPDDNPPRPCPRKFALSECRAAAAVAADPVVRPADVPSIYDVVPPRASDWLDSKAIPGAASSEWRAGWDACRTRCRSLLDAHLQRGREADDPGIGHE